MALNRRAALRKTPGFALKVPFFLLLGLSPISPKRRNLSTDKRKRRSIAARASKIPGFALQTHPQRSFSALAREKRRERAPKKAKGNIFVCAKCENRAQYVRVQRVACAVDQLGTGYRTARGAEVPDWVVAVAHHLPSYKVGRLLHKWTVEIPKVLMPNRQRTLRSFFSAAGAPGAAGTARPTAPAATAADTALTPSAGAGDSER